MSKGDFQKELIVGMSERLLRCICCGKPITEAEKHNNQGASVCDEHFGLYGFDCSAGIRSDRTVKCPLQKQGKCKADVMTESEEIQQLILLKAYKKEVIE